MNNKWKEFLLKSSLPLEFIIAAKAQKLNFSVYGEYTYLRNDRNANNSEFSVDIHSGKLISNRKDFWAFIDLLVECKYSAQNTQWIFSILPEAESGIPLAVRILNDLTTRRFPEFDEMQRYKPAPIESFLENIPYCFKGIKLHDSGYEPEIIERGFSQLAYAIPNLMKNRLILQAREWNNVDLWIYMICPILVTTSPLLVLNKDIEIEKVQNASNISEITTEVPILLLHRPAGADLYQYATKIYDDIMNNVDVKIRLSELNRLRKEPFENYLGNDFGMRINYYNSLSTIIVVNYSAFEKTIRSLIKSVQRSYSKLIRIGYLHKDMEKRKRWVSAEPLLSEE